MFELPASKGSSSLTLLLLAAFCHRCCKPLVVAFLHRWFLPLPRVPSATGTVAGSFVGVGVLHSPALHTQTNASSIPDYNCQDGPAHSLGSEDGIEVRAEQVM